MKKKEILNFIYVFSTLFTLDILILTIKVGFDHNWVYIKPVIGSFLVSLCMALTWVLYLAKLYNNPGKKNE